MAKEFSMQCSPPPPMLYLGAQYAGLATLFSTSEVFLLYRLFSRFSLDDLTASFEGDFKQQATVNSNWLPLGGAVVPTGANNCRTVNGPYQGQQAAYTSKCSGVPGDSGGTADGPA